MPAELGQQILAGGECGKHIDAVDGTGGAFDYVAYRAQHDGGAIETLDDAAGHDADDAGVPFWVVKHDGVSLARGELPLGHTGGLLCDVAVERLALPVEFLDGLHEFGGAVFILGEHQVHCEPGRGEPSGRVDARAQAEDEAARVEAPGFKAG